MPSWITRPMQKEKRKSTKYPSSLTVWRMWLTFAKIWATICILHKPRSMESKEKLIFKRRELIFKRREFNRFAAKINWRGKFKMRGFTSRMDGLSSREKLRLRIKWWKKTKKFKMTAPWFTLIFWLTGPMNHFYCLSQSSQKISWTTREKNYKIKDKK